MTDDEYEKQLASIKAERLKVREDYKNSIKNFLHQAEGFNIRSNVLPPNLNRFSMYKELERMEIKERFLMTEEPVMVVNIQYYHKITAGKISLGGDDIYPFGYFHTEKIYPNTFFQPETLKHKLEEWVNPIETDFPQNKLFSRKYYVLTTDPNSLKRMLPAAALDYLAEIPPIFLEVIGNRCLLRLDTKPVNKENMFQVFQTALRLYELLK